MYRSAPRGADGYASAGKSNGSYQSVGQQSGLFAGDGGPPVGAGHVNLVGSAIASANATHLLNPIICEIYQVKKPAAPNGDAAKGKQ